MSNLPDVHLGKLFTLKHGYIGGPVLEMKEHILIDMLHSHYTKPQDMKKFIAKLQPPNSKRKEE